MPAANNTAETCDFKSGNLRDAHGDPLPPWKAFPKLPRFSVGWRMGRPELYLTQWHEWYAQRDESERRDYRRRHRAPWPHWTGFYLNCSGSGKTTAFGFAVTATVFFVLATSRFAMFPLGSRAKID